MLYFTHSTIERFPRLFPQNLGLPDCGREGAPLRAYPRSRGATANRTWLITRGKRPT